MRIRPFEYHVATSQRDVLDTLAKYGPYAHARIKYIDTSRAKSRTRVKAIVNGCFAEAN